MTSLLWLRRDLRLHDHKPLALAAENGVVQPIFIFDPDILGDFPSPQDKRLSFIAEALCQLHSQLQQQNGQLLVFYGRAEEIIPRISAALAIHTVFAGEDYEPGTRKRDAIVKQRLAEIGIGFNLSNDHLLIPPPEITKSDGLPYKIFTPFARQWLSQLDFRHYAEIKAPELRFATPKAITIAPLNLSNGAEELLEQIGYCYNPLPLWPTIGVNKRLDNFIEHKITHYKEARDFVERDGTSSLSPYLRFGLLSIRECYRKAKEIPAGSSWINELIWRDFYAHILYFFPDSATQEFQPQYRGLPWNKDELLFERFTHGMTGYPIVDAAIRQLNTTGWMHNRARMIVASFLTKDLLLDWRLGEHYFSQNLMDYELSSNVGGWQWAASTGTDAQPYFRIFNPTLQGKKFDPEGHYVRKYVPELKHLPTSLIHEPEKYKQRTGKALSYPSPIVDHAVARERALALLKKQ